MRTLHLDAGRELRGGQFQVLTLLQGLGSEAILLADPTGPLLQTAKQRGIDARPFSIATLTTLSRQVEIVHAHDARTHAWAAALSNAKLVVSRRVAFPVRTSFLSRWKYRRADRYLAISQHVRGILVRANVPENRISVVYDGVHLPPQVAHGSTIVALASRDPMKGRDLVESAALLCGRPIHYSENLESDLPSAAVFVYVTRSEGLGSAALLAMAHGVPVVASQVGGLPEVVQHGRNGALTENEPEAIAAAIETVFHDRASMAIAARRTVEDRFTAVHMIRNTQEVYCRMAAC